MKAKSVLELNFLNGSLPRTLTQRHFLLGLDQLSRESQSIVPVPPLPPSSFHLLLLLLFAGKDTFWENPKAVP